MDQCEACHGGFTAIPKRDPVDVEKTYLCSASCHHCLQWHVWSYGWHDTSFGQEEDTIEGRLIVCSEVYTAEVLATGPGNQATSAKCKSVRKPHANLPYTPAALTSASKYFQMLPAPTGALQSALRLCKSILRCSGKRLQLWMGIQNATRIDN